MNDKYTEMDWVGLWDDLVDKDSLRRQRKYKCDVWYGRADHYRDRVKKRWKKGADSSRQFMIDSVQTIPGATLLDVGAGTGAWSLMLAPFARSVTALDNSKAMLDVLRTEIREAGIANIDILQASWPCENVDKHDIVFCSHAMYGCKNFPEFVRMMQEKAHKRVVMLIRVPDPNALMGQMARLVFGHPYDSPNFHLAYNILLSMGIFPNVIMEDRGWWKPWVCETFEEALQVSKERLGLFEDDTYDEKLMAMLKENLLRNEEGYSWPRGVRTALIYWDVE